MRALPIRLTHPSTITIYDYGRTPEGIFYYAMELLEGATLEAVVEVSGQQPAGRVIHIVSQVASALVEAHAAGSSIATSSPPTSFFASAGACPTW